jgi:hypothetical protein
MKSRTTLLYGCDLKANSVRVKNNGGQTNREGFVTPIDHLMIDAKEAILEEQHRRFQNFHREGRWVEALQQMHVTLNCASDLLNESLRVLDETLENSHLPSSNGSPTST